MNGLRLGVISGSERTATSESGYLDRDTYENSNLRSQSKFAGHYSRIYDIFLSYRERKMELGDFDAAERSVVLVLQSLACHSIFNRVLKDARYSTFLCKSPFSRKKV